MQKLLFFLFASLQAKTIGFYNLHNMSSEPFSLQPLINAGHELCNYSSTNPLADKIIVYTAAPPLELLQATPKDRLIFIMLEPHLGPPAYPKGFFNYFSKVYTWNDDWLDGVKFFKVYYPTLIPMIQDLVPFEEKKFCTLIAAADQWPTWMPNELYSERVSMVDFFETKPEGEFDLYGHHWQKRPYRDYKGPIGGWHSGPEKIQVLKNYRFCICFENTKKTHGYITEKIFCCFAAGCIPVYWGADNIEHYIPHNCFIDYRSFQNKEHLYQFLKSIDKDTYREYIENIRNFLSSAKAEVFSPRFFEKMLLQAIEE